MAPVSTPCDLPLETPWTPGQRFLKRTFDISLALIGIAATGWIMLLAYVAASIETRRSGLFVQDRIGRMGKTFPLLKIRTMRDSLGATSTVTQSGDPRITRTGRIFRKAKIDEFPQLINVLLGHMSFVGPRPDVSGFADLLVGESRLILAVRPGITGPATLKYVNEEELLAKQIDPEQYNREVLYPDKVKLNLQYVRNHRFILDIQYIIQTII